MYLSLLLCYFAMVFGYKNTPAKHFFNNWFCIGIKNEIDFSKPYAINIGELPLVVWKDNNKLLSTINICKHMGSKMDNGHLVNGCLKCPYHGLEMSQDDCFGETVEHEGKIFWSYNPHEKMPFKIPHYNDPKYVKSFLTFDMETSLRDSALNTMDIRHPEYVHKNGFGSAIPPTDIQEYKYKDNIRFGLSFQYASNRIMQQINENEQITKNFNMFIYPVSLWNRVTFNGNHLIISVNLLPLGPKKTRWYVTLLHNYYKRDMQMKIMQLLASGILMQDYYQLKNQHPEDALKREMVFNYKYKNEQVLHWLNDRFQEYKYPDIEMCAELYRNHKNSSLKL